MFDTSVKKERVLPCPPGGEAIADPKLPKAELYLVVGSAKVRPVPRYSRREQLAQVVAQGTNPFLKRNVANRLWALMMGRGLVHPLDFYHSDNPPSHPELLELLGDYLVQTRYDLREFLRQLALSRTYQRSSTPGPQFPKELLEPSRFAVAALRPLSPEQLAWSMMEATGTTTVARQRVRQQLLSDPRLRDIVSLDSKRQRLLEEMVQQRLVAAWGRNTQVFAQHYAGPSGESQDQFFATALQALFLNNGSVIRSWLTPRMGNLMDRLLQKKDPDQLAEEMYLSVLTRFPTPEERQAVAQYLQGRDQDRQKAIGEMVWALLASVEFRFNH